MPPETTPAGATPVAEGATPSQSTSAAKPTTSDSSSDPSATDDAALGDAGKRAIDRMKAERDEAQSRAKSAEKERDELKLATASDSEKAIAQAKNDGKAEVIERLHATVRRSAVREALVTAGALPSLVSDLSRADEFAGLKVGDNDEIDPKELTKAVAAHKERVPDAYKAPVAPAGTTGSADGGAAGGGQPRAASLEEAVNRHYNRQPTS